MRSREELRKTLQELRLHGLLRNLEQVAEQPWLHEMLEVELAERQRRSLENRKRLAALGVFKAMADFNWSWPKKIDRVQCEELLRPGTAQDGSNIVILGPSGVGKTMLMKNIAWQAVLEGRTVLVRSASEMLRDLGMQETMKARARRLKAYVQPSLLCIDEVGYLSYDNTHADLLFEVITRRHEASKSIALTTNREFSAWSEVFPSAACVVALVDRLVHRAELVKIEGDSYRLKEAEERVQLKTKERAIRRKTAAS
jgi:DNA replication protein DnaC